MKEPILDTPFRDSFYDFLETKEEIIWKGEPKRYPSLIKNEKDFFGFAKNDIRGCLNSTFGILLFSIGFIQLEDYLIARLIWFFGYIASILAYDILIKNPYKQIEYALTQNKAIFKFIKKGSKKVIIHSLPFKDIAKVDVAMEKDFDNIGAIFFYLKNPNEKPFTIRNVRHGVERYQITMELIEHPNEVVKLIREGIENAKDYK